LRARADQPPIQLRWRELVHKPLRPVSVLLVRQQAEMVHRCKCAAKVPPPAINDVRAIGVPLRRLSDSSRVAEKRFKFSAHPVLHSARTLPSRYRFRPRQHSEMSAAALSVLA
jgi:hypothetical protein